MASAHDPLDDAATCCCFPSWKHKRKGELRERLTSTAVLEPGDSYWDPPAASVPPCGWRPCTDGGFVRETWNRVSRLGGDESDEEPHSGDAAHQWHGVRPLGVRGPLPPEVEAHQLACLHDALAMLEEYGLSRDRLLAGSGDVASELSRDGTSERDACRPINERVTCRASKGTPSFEVALHFAFPSSRRARLRQHYAAVPLPMFEMCALVIESDLVPLPKWRSLPHLQLDVLHRFAPNDLLFNNRLAPFAVFDGSDSVQGFVAFALPQPGHILVHIASPPEGCDRWRGVPVHPPAPRSKRNQIHCCVWLLRPSGARGETVDVDVFLSEDLPLPAWLIPAALVRNVCPPLIGQVVSAWQRLAAGLESPESAIGERMREDAAGFYATLREWLGGWGEKGEDADSKAMPAAA